MSQHLTKAVSTTAEQYALHYTIQWVEQFPATNNNPNAVTFIERAAKQLHMKLQKIHTPFSWTEDFSYYLMKTPGALFGLGSGKNHPVLHSNTYDFPDKLLILGVQIFLQLIKEINTTYPQETV